MADYYTKFSCVISLPSQEAQDYALKLARHAEKLHQGDTASDPENYFDRFDHDAIEGWDFEVEAVGGPPRQFGLPDDPRHSYGLWLHSDNGGMYACCCFVQHLLKKEEEYQPAKFFTLEWSNDCSKPRLDAFGGGAAFVTAETIEFHHANDWLREQIKAWNAGKATAA